MEKFSDYWQEMEGEMKGWKIRDRLSKIQRKTARQRVQEHLGSKVKWIFFCSFINMRNMRAFESEISHTDNDVG